MADILTIKRMLAEQAQAVSEKLLPNGRKDGHEWRCGSTAGETGQSLGVHLSGKKAGVWTDFNTGEGGDLLDLWCVVRGISLQQALDEARSWLGMDLPEPYRDPRPQYTRPPKPKCKAPEGSVHAYLTVDRNLPIETLQAFKVGEDGDKAIFPFLLPDGALVLAKSREAKDGGKTIPTAKDCEPVLFGWQALRDSAREVAITEGEIDAMSLHAYGIDAMSVPFGGGKGAKQQWIENEFDRLGRFERIYLALDMDGPGEEAANEIASRLGRHRCYRVKLPRKDANECLVEGVTGEEIRECFQRAQALDPEGLKRPSDFADDVVNLFWPKSDEPEGYYLPYGKLKDKLFFRPAEVTLWSGDTGDGKSQILSDGTIDFISQGSRICLASLEMRPAMTLKRKVKQITGTDRPTEPIIRASHKWLDQGLILYGHVGKASVDGLLEVFDYARAKYGCDQFIIDSLMRIGIASDDYAGQEKAVFQIVDWAIQHSVHVHLVAHARKPERGRGSPGTHEIKGASEIGANAFNVITVWRNRSHEDDLKEALESGNQQLYEELNQKPGVIMNLAKQRNGDFEGKIGLWFDQQSYRYASSMDRSAQDRRYLPDDWNVQAAE